MIFYTYKITLTEGRLQGHYYLGKHQTENLNDGYKGSGKIIKNYYKKHPKGFVKEILQFYNSIEELNEAEKSLIGNLNDTDPLCLNIKPGGEGGSFKGINKGIKHDKEWVEKTRNAAIGRVPWNKGLHYHYENKEEVYKTRIGKTSPRKNAILSDNTKDKISNTLKEYFKTHNVHNACKVDIIKDDKVLTFTSAAQVAQFLNCSPAWITKCHNNNLPCKGYIIKYKSEK